MAELSQQQLQALRSALGVTADVTDSDLQSLSNTPAGKAILQRIEAQPSGGGGGGLSGFLQSKIAGPLETVGKDLSKTIGPGDTPAWIAENIGGLGVPEALDLAGHGIKNAIMGGPAPKKGDAAKKPTKGGDQTNALEQLAQYLTQGYVQQGEVAMGQMGQELAQQNKAVTGTVDQFLTGTPSGNAAVDAAQAAYAKAYSAGEGLNSAAYANMGAANAQYEAASPLQPVLSILTSGLGSGQYKQLPTSLVENLPAEVQYALQQAGVGVTNPGTTGTSGQPIPTPKGGWPKSITAGQAKTGASTLSSLLSGALAPSATNPVSNPNQYGNPNVPGQ